MSDITYLRVSITDRCNFRCRYCMPDGLKQFLPHSEVLRYEEIIEVVRAFADNGVKSVRITGGEPLVKKDVEVLVAGVKKVDGITDVSMTTNGFFLGKFACLLKNSGLDRVNVSLDTLSREKFSFMTGVDGIDKVIEGVEKAVECGLTPVKVNVVLMKGFNDGELGDFVLFSDRMGVEVRFIEIMPVGGKSFSMEHFFPVSEAKREIEEEFGKLIPYGSYGSGPAETFRIEGTNAVIGFIGAVSQHFCDRCNRLRLTSDGKIRLCLVRDEEIDLKRILRSGDYTYKGLVDEVRRIISIKAKVNGIEALKGKGCERKMMSIGG